MNEHKPETVQDIIYEALKILQTEEGIMVRGDLMNAVEKRGLTGNIPNWRARFGRASRVLVKGGFLLRGGQATGWELTPRGVDALESNDSAKQFFAAARKRISKRDGDMSNDSSKDAGDGDDSKEEDKGDVKDHAIEKVRGLEPEQFEKLCAALLLGMGYHFVSYTPITGDGGIDIKASADPLGASRVIVQAKRYKKGNNVGVSAVRELAGVLTKEGDVGVLITTSKFTSDCIKEARSHPNRIELISGLHFIDLWIKYYDKVPEYGRKLLPIDPSIFSAED